MITMRLRYTVFAIITATAALGAQQRPRFSSPEVGADRTLTLRYYAPNAKAVTANGELDGKPHPMTRLERDGWAARS